MILDTSFLLDLKDGDTEAFETATTLYDEGVVQRVAMPSVWELHYGAAFTESEAERRKVTNLLLMYPIEDVDERTARHGATLLAAADREHGGNCGVANEDALIAAVGDLLDEPVVTRNEADFERLGVETVTY